MAHNMKVNLQAIFISVACLTIFFASHVACSSLNIQAGGRRKIKPNNIYYVENDQSRPEVSIFCWSGEAKTLLGFWKTATVHLNTQNDDFTIYKGDNETHVLDLHQSLQASWFSFLPWKEKLISITPFNASCVGVYTKQEYQIKLDVRQINFNRFLLFISGMILFLIAPSLCEKVAFQYTSGTLIGVFGSILIIVYLLSRLIPKKSGALTFIVGGSSIVLYVLKGLWDNMYSVLREYYYLVLGYVILSSIISFGLCYRFGPVTNPKTVHLLQWTLQVAGLILVFGSSEHKEAAMGSILITLVIHNFPSVLLSSLQTMWLKKFPPKVRLLTEDEYFDQSRIETKKALEELRSFSRSPNCNAWKTMSRLKDPLRDRKRTKPVFSARCVEFVSPKVKSNTRFAEFVEGGSHLCDREVLDYETTTIMPDLDTWTDDESEDEQT